jgi:multisubunit Na+/H+ antiporter MnhB subunit
MYYIWSFAIAIILFAIVQYIEYEKNRKLNKKYDIFTIINGIIFFIIYILSTILCYYILSDDNDILNFKDKIVNNDIIDTNNNIDPLVLKKIPDNFNIGFEPFDENE